MDDTLYRAVDWLTDEYNAYRGTTLSGLEYVGMIEIYIEYRSGYELLIEGYETATLKIQCEEHVILETLQDMTNTLDRLKRLAKLK